LTLNKLDLSYVPTTGFAPEISSPFLNLIVGTPIPGIENITAIGTGSGANTISKTGPGNLAGLNLTGIGSTVPLNLTNLTNGTFSLLHDGDGTGSQETIELGAITHNPANGILSLIIGRAGSTDSFFT